MPHRTAFALLLLLAAPALADPVAGLKLPPGFAAAEFAGPAVANDIFCLHVDARGRVVVGGRGYVRWLPDDDGDGVADRAVELVGDLKDGVMGLLWEDADLYVVTSRGLVRYRNVTGATPATNPEVVVGLKAPGTTGEHDAHAVRRGPDGWLYFLCGNMAGVTPATVTGVRTPIKLPTAGVLLRIGPNPTDGVEAVTDGFRNAYDFDFGPGGEPFVFDSDNERCVGLPWFEPTRFYHAVPGGNAGWRTPQAGQFWRKPPEFADVLPPVATLGRGSPTGVANYRHSQFPEKYRGGFFLADWTFGKVWFVAPTPSGSTFTGTPEPFLEATGENGFAPTGLAVHPTTGELFVSIGGRGTRGGVYRVRAAGGPASPTPRPVAPRRLDWRDGDKPRVMQAGTAGTAAERRHALDAVWRHREQFAPADVTALVAANAGSDDRLVRQAVGRLAGRLGGLTDPALVTALADPRADLAVWAGLDSNPLAAVVKATEVIDRPKVPAAVKADACRLIHRAAGDLTAKAAAGTVFEGYTFAKDLPADARRWALAACRKLFPTGDAVLDRELARVLAAGADDDPTAGAKLAAVLTADSDPLADEHVLFCLARLAAPLSASDVDRVARAFLSLDRKLAKAGIARDRHWPLRVGEAFAALVARNPALPNAVVASPEFGRPDHVLFVPADAPAARVTAARQFLQASAKDPAFDWTPQAAALLGVLPDAEIRARLGALWDRGGLEDVVVQLLARSPTEADRPKLVAGLRSIAAPAVSAAATGLASLPAAEDDLIPAVRALRRLGPDAANAAARDRVAALLRHQTGQDLPPDAKAWEDWLTREKPVLAKKLAAATGFDPDAWKKKLAEVPWEAGDVLAGKRAFAKASCAACHDGNQAVGPSLLGVAKRFSRDDLLTAVLDPNRDVSPRYRTVRVTTDDDKVFEGVPIYEANDGVILQTGAETTVRIAGNRVASRKPGTVSLMPAGLLDPLTPREVADLFAYLRSLDGK